MKFKRDRYQQSSIRKVPRAKCFAWEFRFYHTTPDGTGKLMVPIVAMTANAMERDRQLCLGVGMNDFVTKPVSVAVLRDTLKKWLPSGDSVIPTAASQLGSLRTAESEAVVFDPASALAPGGGQ